MTKEKERIHPLLWWLLVASIVLAFTTSVAIAGVMVQKQDAEENPPISKRDAAATCENKVRTSYAPPDIYKDPNDKAARDVISFNEVRKHMYDVEYETAGGDVFGCTFVYEKATPEFIWIYSTEKNSLDMYDIYGSEWNAEIEKKNRSMP